MDDYTIDMNSIGKGYKAPDIGGLAKASPAPKNTLEDTYASWKQNPSQEATQNFLQAAQPVIGKAMQSYVGSDDPAAKAKAKILVYKALQNYNPNKGTKLQTYLLTQMQPLHRFASQRRVVTHIPEQSQRDMSGLEAAYQELKDRLARDPSISEIADHTGISVKRIEMLRGIKKDLPSSASVDVEGKPRDTAVSKKEYMDEWMDYVYYDLNPVDKKILEWRTGYGGEKVISNKDIAKNLNLSQGAVSQRVTHIMDRIDEGKQYARN